MATVRTYSEMFIVELMHSYYQDGVNSDFIIEPTDNTVQVLRNYNLLLRKSEQSRIGVYYERSGASKLQLEATKSIDKPIKLSFTIRLRNPNLLNFTDLQGVPEISSVQGKPIFYFSNMDSSSGRYSGSGQIEVVLSKDASGKVSEKDKINLLPALFSVPIQTGHRFVRIVRIIPNDPEVEVAKVEIKGDPKSVSFDWRGRKSGWYEIQWLLNVNPLLIDKREAIYIDPSLLSNKPLGIIEIYLDASFIGKGNLKFLLQFAHKNLNWTYIIIDKNGLLDNNQSDLISYTEQVPYPNGVRFNKLNDSEIGQIISTEQRSSLLPGNLYLLRADQSFPSFEVPLRSLKLALKNGFDLPLASLSQQAIKPEIFIHL